jgi:type I restriction enzyme, R subunit
MNKKDLSERDICSKFIGPAIKRAGWDGMMQIREEVAFTKGRIIVRGKLVTRGKAKRADYILYYKPNLPIAIVEAKDNNHSVGDGMQQALDYATTLNIPFVFSSNGDGFVFHDCRMESQGTAHPSCCQSKTPHLRLLHLWVGIRNAPGIL